MTTMNNDDPADPSVHEQRGLDWPEPVAYLHDVVAADGEPDQALSFAPDNFPLMGVGGFRSVAYRPLYTADQMREYAAGEVARATATLNACLLQMQEAAKDLAPHRKPYARDSFEAWASDAYKWPNAIERSGEGYRLMQTQSSWEAWSMAWGSAEAACWPSTRPTV